MSKLPVQKSVNSPKIDLDPESGRTEAPDRTGPPRISHWLLCKMVHYETSHRCAGDFVEEYRRIVLQEGETKARHWYRSQVLKSIPPYLAYLFTWKMSMLYNYLKIALRNMQKHKAYSIINLLSLTLGMSCCLLIYIWVQDEFQYDRFQANRQRIAQVYSVTRYSDGRESVFMGSYYPLARILSDDVPGIVTASRLQVANELFVRRGERKFVDNVVGLADPSFFRIFTFRWIKGIPRQRSPIGPPS